LICRLVEIDWNAVDVMDRTDNVLNATLVLFEDLLELVEISCGDVFCFEAHEETDLGSIVFFEALGFVKEGNEVLIEFSWR
jgi:hypothetical protein